MPELKAWQLQGECVTISAAASLSSLLTDLGLQASQRVMESSGVSALLKLKELSQNLPTMVK